METIQSIFGVIILLVFNGGITVSLVILIIKANRTKNQVKKDLQNQLLSIKWGLLVTTALCLWFESGLELFFSPNNYINGNYKTYSFIILFNFTGYATTNFIKIFDRAPYVKMTFIGSSFMLSLATTIYFIPMLPLFFVLPFIGLLGITPLIISLVFFLDMVSISKQQEAKKHTPFVATIIITLFLGLTILLILQLIFNASSESNWDLIHVFLDNSNRVW